jgi:hypothetical protein
MTELQTLLDSDPTPEQREAKYLLDASGARSLLAAATARLRLSSRRSRCPYTYVRTTYYDTPDAAHYRSSFGPVTRRLRMREYATKRAGGAPQLADVCYLELKQSSDGRRAKVRVPLRAGEVGARLALLDELSLAPCVSSWYRRIAFGDGADRVRVTLDDSLMFCEPMAIGSPLDFARRQVLAAGPPFVLEVKLWGEAPRWLADRLALLEEALGFSKFTLGMRAAHQGGLDARAVAAASR